MVESHLKNSAPTTLTMPPVGAASVEKVSRQHAAILPTMALPVLLLGILLLVGAGMVNSLAKAPPAQQRLSGFSTSLLGRSRNQRRNAELASRSIDGRVIPAGGVFSFNQTVKSWSVDQGYVKALVSYDGDLVRAYGGGVCQTSTTLYNAALLAGLPILERHSHVFVPHYITPGRDAAVAFPGVDLRFKNTNPWPIRIKSQVRGDRLEVSLMGAGAMNKQVTIKTRMLSVTKPQRLTRVIARKDDGSEATRSPRTYIHSAGTAGYRVVTYRVISADKKVQKRECLSDDTYPAMDRVIALERD